MRERTGTVRITHAVRDSIVVRWDRPEWTTDIIGSNAGSGWYNLPGPHVVETPFAYRTAYVFRRKDGAEHLSCHGAEQVTGITGFYFIDVACTLTWQSP
jgi:hypothetical protein